ncbi:MAG: hypothetical protein OHK0013_43510 [Sandaracinaceae bacterium]
MEHPPTSGSNDGRPSRDARPIPPRRPLARGSFSRSSMTPRARYRCSPEHKQHPGSWGHAQWHPRMPDLSPCPRDIVSDDVPQKWLDQALLERGFWDPNEGDRYVYWFDVERKTFFVARRTQEAGAAGQEAEYKGYPVRDREVPGEVIEHLRVIGTIDDTLVDRARRARRRR